MVMRSFGEARRGQGRVSAGPAAGYGPPGAAALVTPGAGPALPPGGGHEDGPLRRRPPV